ADRPRVPRVGDDFPSHDAEGERAGEAAAPEDRHRCTRRHRRETRAPHGYVRSFARALPGAQWIGRARPPEAGRKGEAGGRVICGRLAQRRIGNTAFQRHARACRGHPRLTVAPRSKTWMAGTKPAMTEKRRSIAPRKKPKSALAAFVVDRELARNVGTPEVERILRLVVGGRPAFVLRDVVDVAGIFRETAPRITHVVEIVRAQHMTAKTPALGPAFVVHAHGAEADVVEAGDVPTAMVEAGRARLHQSEQMMVAAVDAVHESDEVGGAVRQAQAKRALVELDRLQYVAGEDENVRQAARPHRRGFRTRAGAGLAGGNAHPLTLGLPVGRHFGPDLDLDQHALMVAEPEAIALETGRRIDQLDALVLNARLQARQVIGVAAERQMMQRLGLDAFNDGAPAVILAEGL